ncbi:hypothetical protein V5P93_004094 [Actinokineospora auranticolor]|uniref:hypothetical protein n=1 Tax=Actinokineospora auranticolor TaxID=155976 RepID=UPI0015E35D24|nr:hypothetical protein [Actinokineospora auranticolor]
MARWSAAAVNNRLRRDGPGDDRAVRDQRDVDRVRTANWYRPLMPRLFLMDQEQDFFRVRMFRDGDLRRLVPATPNEDSPGYWDPPTTRPR